MMIRSEMMNVIGSQYYIKYEDSINYIIQEYRRCYDEIDLIFPKYITDNLSNHYRYFLLSPFLLSKKVIYLKGENGVSEVQQKKETNVQKSL
jgi:hypothetical protein